MRPRTIAICGSMLALAGCAEGNSIYHDRPNGADGGRVITVDAKQRSIFLMPEVETGAADAVVPNRAVVSGQPVSSDRPATKWRLCAEAAPDVFSAISASAGLDADVTERKAKLAAAIAEATGTVERTQTINLLRESMYRTCERYLSGAIDQRSFVVQAARDQRTMLSVLAIEQLTRTARPPAIILAPAGTNVSIPESTTASTTAGTNSNGQGGGTPSDEALRAIAAAVTTIAANTGIDESLMFCIAYLSSPPPKPDVSVSKNCNDIILRRAQNDEQLRGKILRYDVGEISIGETTYSAPRSSDTATPTLRAYLGDMTLSAAERSRRMQLAGKIATRLGLIVDPSEITLLILSGNASAAAPLLAQLRSEETDTAGREALGVN